MDEVLHANIFFLITSIAVVAISILLIVALIYTIKAVRNFSRISEVIKEKSEKIGEDVDMIRNEIKSHTKTASGIAAFLLGRFSNKVGKNKHNKKNEEK